MAKKKRTPEELREFKAQRKENYRLRDIAKNKRKAPRIKFKRVRLACRGRKALSVKRMALSGTHSKICFEEVEKVKEQLREEPNMIKIDILQGLTDEQKIIIKLLVEKRGYNPMGFSVDVKNNEIYYFGGQVL